MRTARLQTIVWLHSWGWEEDEEEEEEEEEIGYPLSSSSISKCTHNHVAAAEMRRKNIHEEQHPVATNKQETG
jgi:hypothetical protein